MRLCTRFELYHSVPVHFWPWVFAQLLFLDLWVEQAGRDVLGAVCRRTGRVYLMYQSDDPALPKAWRPDDLAPYLPGHLSRVLTKTEQIEDRLAAVVSAAFAVSSRPAAPRNSVAMLTRHPALPLPVP